MDDARKKLRICLFCVVMAAVIIGAIYYVGEMSSGSNINEGTLVMSGLESRG